MPLLAHHHRQCSGAGDMDQWRQEEGVRKERAFLGKHKEKKKKMVRASWSHSASSTGVESVVNGLKQNMVLIV